MDIKEILRKNIILTITILVFLIITSYSSITTISNQTYLESINTQLSSTKTQTNDYTSTLEDTIKSINVLKNQNKTILRDPTYSEALRFITNDTTDENIYHETDYNCVHFSTDVNNNAEKQGLRCAYAELIFDYNFPHAIIAFNTTDRGLVFFEPQLDEIANIELGKDYWTECLENSTKEIYGNIIMDYILYW